MKNRPLYLLATVALLGSVSACGQIGQPAYNSAAVTASDSSCSVSQDRLQEGHTTFHIQNDGSSASNVSLFAEDRSGHFTTEKAHTNTIAPGSKAQIGIMLRQGQYQFRCQSSGTRHIGYVRVAQVQGGAGGSDNAYNDDFRFVITPQGDVTSGEPQMKTKAGDELKLELYNHARSEYDLVVTNAQGQQVGGLVADAEKLGQSNVEIDTPGHYKVQVYSPGHKSAGKSFDLTVDK